MLNNNALHNHTQHRLLEVTEADKELCGRVRVPKAIVFSLDHWVLQVRVLCSQRMIRQLCVFVYFFE